VWARLLVRVFGAGSFAVTTVLAAYMAGLALGSLLFGRLIDRRGNPLRIYALLQMGIAVFAVAFPYIITVLSGLYSGLYPDLQNRFYLLTGIRFLLCFGVLLIPTTLMGGTFPVLSNYLATSLSSLTERVGRLYAVNTMGAVCGAFASGLVILPRLGIRDTTLLCAALSIGVVVVALLLSRKPRAVPEQVSAVPGLHTGGQSFVVGNSRLVLAIFTVTGFCALAAEVVWTRMLSLVLGTTVYAFAIMLTVFLLGLGSGSAAFARRAQSTKHPGRLLGLAIAAVGFSVFLSLAVFGRIPFLYMSLYERIRPDWGGLLWMQVLLCAITMLLPTFFMGALFPLVARLYARDIARVGREIGQIYAFNTVGAILGSIAGTLVFLRGLGMVKSLVVIGCLYVLTGVIALVRTGEFRRLGARVSVAGGVAAFAVIILFVSPDIDKKTLTSGVYRYAPIYGTVEGLRTRMRLASILFYNEGIDATVSVEGFRGEIAILIDGKADASNGAEDMRTQVLLAQLPLLFHGDPDTVLVIGLGSGVTLGSAETHGLRWVDCVELLENVVEASHYMREYNLDCLDDPRANLIIGDGRNHLLLSGRTYDVIISEPTNPWISGVGDLFTQEFFRLARSRLKPDGIICAWFHTYHMGDQDVRAMVATFTSVFPDAYLWLVNDADVILLGALKPLAFDQRIRNRMVEPAIAEDMGRIGIRSVPDLVSFFVAGPGALTGYAKSARELHTDDNMLLEFSAGLKVFKSTESVHISRFIDLIESPPAVALEGVTAQDLLARLEARRLAMRASVALSGQGIDAAMPLLEEAFSMSPTDPYILHKYIEGRMAVGNNLHDQRDYEGAKSNYLEALAVPDHSLAWLAYLGLGMAQVASGDGDGARQSYRQSIERNPYNPRAYHNLGKLERVMGNTDRAAAALERSLELEPGAGPASDLSRIYIEMGTNLEKAVRLAEQAVSWEASSDHYITLGWARNVLGDYQGGEEAILKALEMEPGNTEAMWGLGQMRLTQGNIDGARTVLRELLALGKNDMYSRLARQKMDELKGR
jgi:spermidine synthase